MELNTTQKLCDYIAANWPHEITDGNGPLDAAIWFCCIQEAKNISGLSLKDLAGLVMTGLPSYADAPAFCIQRWLDGYKEYIETSIEEGEDYTSLEVLLKDFYEPDE